MNIDKTKIFICYISLKSSIYIFERKEDFIVILDLIYENEYIESFSKLIQIITETIEYIITINF